MSLTPLLELLGSHLLLAVGFTMAAILMASILTERRPTGSTFAWLLAIIFIPYIGVPLFLVFGGRKLKKRAAEKEKLYAGPSAPDARGGDVARVLCSLGAPPPTTGNDAELLVDGEAAYAAVIEALRSAKTSIHLSTLIFADDEVGRAVGDVLCEKARAGVEVRVLIDAFFKFRSSRRQMSELVRAGAKVAWFMPVWHLPFRGNANLRLHRKTVTVDDRLTILGGMNVAREYMGPAPLEGRWRDLSARITGRAVRDVARIFVADWRFASGEKLAPPADDGAGGEANGGAEIQVVGSGPDVEGDLLYDAFLSAIYEARRRLWIATPYFVPDDALTRAIVLAVRRGVDVRVVVPARSNHLTADLAGATYLRQIARAGGKVACYGPGMMHAKLVLADDALGVLGSANMDMRSLFLDYEIALFFSSKGQIDALDAWFRARLFPACSDLRPAGKARAMIETLARLVAPLE